MPEAIVEESCRSPDNDKSVLCEALLEHLVLRPMSDEEFNLYLEERKTLISTEHELSKTYGKWMLTLSAGALGLSMTFLSEVVGPGRRTGVPWLAGAWLCFAIAIATVMVAIAVAQGGHRAYRVAMDEECSLGGYAFFERVRFRQEHKVWWARTGRFLNHASLFAFCLGICLLSWFLYANLKGLGN